MNKRFVALFGILPILHGLLDEGSILDIVQSFAGSFAHDPITIILSISSLIIVSYQIIRRIRRKRV